MKKCSDSLIFLLIDDTISSPDFESQEEIEELFGEPVPFTLKEYYENEDCFWDYLRSWRVKHKFQIIDKSDEHCIGYEKIGVIYLLDDKYYYIVYSLDLYGENKLLSSSIEVMPIEKVVKITEYFNKENPNEQIYL